MLKPNSCVKKYLNDVVLFVHENTHEIYKRYVKSKFDLRYCQEIPIALVPQNMLKLAGIDTYENIRLIQACIYHYYCKSLSKEH